VPFSQIVDHIASSVRRSCPHSGSSFGRSDHYRNLRSTPMLRPQLFAATTRSHRNRTRRSSEVHFDPRRYSDMRVAASNYRSDPNGRVDRRRKTCAPANGDNFIKQGTSSFSVKLHESFGSQFFNAHRRAFVSGVVEMLGHSFGQPDAAMRRRIGRDGAAFTRRPQICNLDICLLLFPTT
jgi:hypothetical protein